MIFLRDIDRHLKGFERYMQEKSYSKTAVRSYINTMKSFLISNPDAPKYQYNDILNYFGKLAKTDLSVSSRKTILIHLKKYYDYLLDTEQRDDHPCYNLNLKGGINKAVIHTDLFSMYELEKMLEWEWHFKKLDLRNKAIISLLVYQGMTALEAARLKVSHIDMDAEEIYIPGGQTLLSRRIEIMPKQLPILQRYIYEGRRPYLKEQTDKLFFGLERTEFTEQGVRTIIEKFNCWYPERNLKAKTIRDSVISYWLNDLRLPLEQVQLMAGHRWISSTQRYVKSPILDDRAMLNKIHPLGVNFSGADF